MSDVPTMEMRIRDLETRIQELEAECNQLREIEAIKRLRYRYWRCIRLGDWDGLLKTFTENVHVDFGFGIHMEGKEALAKFYADNFSKRYTLRVPQGHNPEIDITSATTAVGLWVLDQSVITSGDNKASRTGTVYEEEYLKDSNGWKISSIKTRHVYNQQVTPTGYG